MSHLFDFLVPAALLAVLIALAAGLYALFRGGDFGRSYSNKLMRLRVLLLDLDVQPTLSSYFTLAERAPAGIYEMLAYNEQRAEQLVSHTAIERSAVPPITGSSRPTT